MRARQHARLRIRPERRALHERSDAPLMTPVMILAAPWARSCRQEIDRSAGCAALLTEQAELSHGRLVGDRIEKGVAAAGVLVLVPQPTRHREHVVTLPFQPRAFHL